MFILQDGLMLLCSQQDLWLQKLVTQIWHLMLLLLYVEKYSSSRAGNNNKHTHYFFKIFSSSKKIREGKLSFWNVIQREESLEGPSQIINLLKSPIWQELGRWQELEVVYQLFYHCVPTTVTHLSLKLIQTNSKARALMCLSAVCPWVPHSSSVQEQEQKWKHFQGEGCLSLIALQKSRRSYIQFAEFF